MANDNVHEHGQQEQPEYDPNHVVLPSRQPPLRSTAPQSDYTFGQVTTGFVVLAVGLAITFGLPLVLV